MSQFDTAYWLQGRNQPADPDGSPRKPAFNYDAPEEDLLFELFKEVNYRDVMLEPLRKFLSDFVRDSYFDDGDRQALVDNGWEDVDSPIDTIYHKGLDLTISYIYAEGQSNFIIKPHDADDTTFVSYYKLRGTTEKILDSEMGTVNLAELDTLYNNLHLKDDYWHFDN